LVVPLPVVVAGLDCPLEAVFLGAFLDAVFLGAFFSFEDAFWEYSLEVLAEAGTVAKPMPSNIEAATAVNICSFFEIMIFSSPVVAVPTATTFHTEDERKMNSRHWRAYVALHQSSCAVTCLIVPALSIEEADGAV
jgi:hypothetical protein